MSEDWSLRDEIYHTAHRWPVLSLFCLVGVLTGWLFSLFWPSPYRATKELYVGLSIYRAAEDANNAKFAGITFYNADDYKNWQMANLNTMVVMDPIVDQILASLRTSDTYWNDIPRAELAGMLHVYWRNAGKWRLVAEHQEAARAKQIVLAWEETAVQVIDTAVLQAQEVINLDIQMQQLAAQKTSLLEQLAEKEAARQELQNAQGFLKSLPADKVLSELERWQIWLPVSQVVTSPEWLEILNNFPVEPSPVHAYLPVVEKAIAANDLEIRSLNGQIARFSEENTRLAAAYTQASEKSMGFSPNLKIDRITEEAPQITHIRPTGVLVLVGASLGFILWLLYTLVSINHKAKS